MIYAIPRMQGKPWDLVVEDMATANLVKSLNGVDGIYLGTSVRADEILARNSQIALWSEHVSPRWVADREFITDTGKTIRTPVNIFDDLTLDMWFIDVKYNVFDAAIGLYTECQGLEEARDTMLRLQTTFLIEHYMGTYVTYDSESIKDVWPIPADV